MTDFVPDLLVLGDIPLRKPHQGVHLRAKRSEAYRIRRDIVLYCSHAHEHNGLQGAHVNSTAPFLSACRATAPNAAIDEPCMCWGKNGGKLGGMFRPGHLLRRDRVGVRAAGQPARESRGAGIEGYLGD